MRTQVNRVLLAFKTWDEKQNELRNLTRSGAIDERVLDRLQLQHLREASHRLRSTARPDEQPFLVLLGSHVDRLEKKLYPNFLQRLFLHLKDRLIDGPNYLSKMAAQRAANLAQLTAELREKRLGEIAGKLEDHLHPDHQQVSLPLNCQLNEDKRLDYDLRFEKDVYGDFKWTRLNGTLTDKGSVVRSHEFELNDWPGLKANQVRNLLEGRALKQYYADTTGQENQRWVELGPEGARYYHQEATPDIATMLDTMPQITRNRQELISYLENGQQVAAHWKQEGQFQRIEIRADPANGTVKLLDSRSKPVSAEQLSQKAKQLAAAKKPQVPEKQQKNRNANRLHV